MVDTLQQRTIGPEGRVVAALGSVLVLAVWSGPDGPMLASGGEDGTVRRWNATTGAPVGDPMTGHTNQTGALAAWTGPDGPMLASGDLDGTIRRWDANTGAPVGDPMTGHTGWVWALAAWTGLDGPMLASASSDGTIRRWNATTGARVGDPMTGHTRPVTALISWTSPDGYVMAASASGDGTIRRWNAAAGTPAGDSLLGGSSGLTAWTDPNDRTLLASPSSAQIICWDATAGTLVGTWTCTTRRRRFRFLPRQTVEEQVSALTGWSSPDGPMLASGSSDGTVRRWNATTGTPIGDPMTGHTGPVIALVTLSSPDGSMLASASNDGTIRRWNATTGTPVGDPMTGHTGSVTALAVWSSPDGAVLASAGADGTIRLWNASTGELLQLVLVEPIRLRGLADRPAARDLLDRGALTQALANLILWRPTTAGGETGPSVVTFEGPWGTGKTTVMRLVQARITAIPESPGKRRDMSVAAARKILRNSKSSGGLTSTISAEDYGGR
jgi:WD40 repeat protein